MACPTVFDRIRLMTEFLPEDLFRLASYNSPWLNLPKREEYKQGSGTNLKTFTIQNIEPSADEETWSYAIPTGGTVESISAGAQGACGVTYNEVGVGFEESTYHPEQFGLKGPTLCKDDLIFEHNARAFLTAYVQELTKRARRSWEKRFETLYMALGRKVVAKESLPISEPGRVDTINKTTGTTKIGHVALELSTSQLTQEMLDTLALQLIDDGATDPDSNGYISLGEDGPVFSLLIGLNMSQQLLKNNTEFRNDLRWAQSGCGCGSGLNTSELMKRLGATRVIKNFRHIPSLRPPRYVYAPAYYGNTTNASAVVTNIFSTANLVKGMPVTGSGIPASTTILSVDSPTQITLSAPATATASAVPLYSDALASLQQANTTSGSPIVTVSSTAGLSVGQTVVGAATLGIPAGSRIRAINSATTFTLGNDSLSADVNATASGSAQAITMAGHYYRVPTHETVSVTTGKGQKAQLTAGYRAAPFEAAIVLTPQVLGTEVIRPINQIGNMNWSPTNYMGEWQFVTGAEKFVADGCADPLQKLAAHFAEFKHAPKPIFPQQGQTIIFKRCATTMTEVTC